MNALLLNRDGFQMPADGWYQIAPVGEFPHSQAGLVQVVDREACEAMVNRFKVEAEGSNFAGLLVDFDHFSLDGEKRSEAAGWVVGLENRDTGLFAKIRWSDVGEEAVKGGRYRFLSPVWSRSDCVDLGPDPQSGRERVRPVRLLNAAVTNDPNLKGMLPLSNSSTALRAGSGAAAGGPQRFKWILGDSPEGRHCPSCAAVAGQVHTMAEWDATGLKPGVKGLFCQGNCHCRLEPTNDPATGGIVTVPLRKETEEVKNSDQSSAISGRSRTGTGGRGNGLLANIGWTDEARAASLFVRQAKSMARKAGSLLKRIGRVKEAELLPDLPPESRNAFEAAVISGALEDLHSSGKAQGMSSEDVDAYLRTALSDAYRRQAERIASGEDAGEKPAADAGGTAEDDVRATDYLGEFEEEGFVGMSPQSIDALSEQLRQKLSRGDSLSEVEEGFLEELAGSGYSGDSENDAIFLWQEKQADKSRKLEAALGMDLPDARAHAGDIELKQSEGKALTPEETKFLETYRKIMGKLAEHRGRKPVDTGIYWGGSKDFDESTGTYRDGRDRRHLFQNAVANAVRDDKRRWRRIKKGRGC